MESKLRNTVLQLKDGSYIHHSKVQRYNKFGYQAIFVNRDKGFQFQVLYFSKSVLELNALTQHLNKTIARFKTLSSRKITPILEVQQKKQQIFVISPNYQHNLSQLIAKREGLSEFQVAYFLGQLYELMGYLKSRDVFIQKIEAQDLSLTQQLKLTMGFSLFLNTIGQRSIIKRLPFRIQYRNRNNCPDLFFKKEISAITIDEVSSWITGILAYQIVQNKLPFPHVNDDLIGRARGCKTEEVFDLLDRQYVLHFKEAEQYTELIDLIKKLLKPNPSQRLKFSFVIIHPFIKKFPIPPHILPTTVFFCPPSQSYKEQYFKKFLKEDRQRGNEAIKDLRALTTQQNLRSQKQIKGFADFEKQKFTKSQFEICSQRVLSENFVMIEQFADISDVFGYGYQMNTGMVGFVFNDETQFLCLNGSQQIRARTNAKRKQEVVYSQQKLPEEDEIRKKIHILEAFVKTLKRKKISASEKQKTVMVSSYCRTKYASVFLLTNNALQVFFNDKIVFYLMKEETYIQHKNSDKFQKYDKDSKDQDLKNRRQYCITVAQKVFLWQTNTQTTILDNSMNDIPQE